MLRYRLTPMHARDPHEAGRTASSLELFFDLVFVTAVSIAAAQLHHSLTEAHVGHGLAFYALVFFAIWWAWMNFTWFATSFGNVFWLLLLVLSGPPMVIVLVVLIVAEIAVPVVAERQGVTPWHPHHITERYGLFTLIVLGESLLASANAVIEAVHEDEAIAPLVTISVLALVVTAAL